MRQHLISALKLFGDRMFFNVLTLFMIPVFIPIIHSLSYGPALFSFTICALYLGIIADVVWKIGKHDRQPYATEKIYRSKGFVIGAISEIPSLLLLVVLLFHTDSAGFRGLYRLMIGPFMGFVSADAVTPAYGLVLVIIPIISGLSYLWGLRRPTEKKRSLSQKIMYKKK